MKHALHFVFALLLFGCQTRQNVSKQATEPAKPVESPVVIDFDDTPVVSVPLACEDDLLKLVESAWEGRIFDGYLDPAGKNMIFLTYSQSQGG